MLISCLVVLILASTRQVRLAFILAFVYVLFALTAGLSLWQGNRIFYPGQIAWTALVAVVLVAAARGVRNLVSLAPPTSDAPQTDSR